MSHRSRFGAASLIVIIAGLVGFGVTSRALASGIWWNAAWHYRLPVTVAAAGYDRFDKPVEVPVNFTTVLTSLGRSGPVATASIHLVETDLSGTLLDTAVAFQFDRATGYDSTTNAAGNLIFLMKGTTASNATRYFTVYFALVGDGYTSESVPAQVSYTDNVTYAGHSSYQISTGGASYYYHKTGGGFAGMKDRNNIEWLGYDPTPGSGSAGEFRGVPNAVFVLNQPQNSYFHPGFTNSTSSIVHSGPLKLTIDSKSTDGGNPWECQWEVFPQYARMTMLTQGASTYWFLYEGTPGGTYNATTNYVVRSDDTKTPGGTTWDGAIGGPEFVYFGDQAVNRVLYFVHHESDNLEDSYRPLNDQMTVFGFSRDLTVTSFFNSVPQHFTMGFSEDTTFAGASKVVLASSKDISGTLGSPELLAANPLRVVAKAFLEGPFSSGSGAMSKALRTSGVLATQMPGALIPAEAVDTVTVEIRDSAVASKATLRSSVHAWILSDGTFKLFADTTKAYVEFSGVDAGNYYVVIRHRNHLAIMSSSAVSLSGTSTLYDFTTAQAKAYGTNPMTQLTTGVFGMYGGDANGSGDVSILDRAVWRTQNSLPGYLGADFNLTGDVSILDRAIWRNNNSFASQVP